MDYVNLIEDINQKLYELIPEKNQDLISFTEENHIFLEFESIGYAHNILFLGIPIWCSENDERPYENEDDPKLCDHMPLDKWLWQEIKRISSLIAQFNEILNKEK